MIRFGIAMLFLTGACSEQVGQPTNPSAAASVAAAKPGAAAANAELGKPAPSFTLKDIEGKDVSLESFKGKTVVLEWFNPQCPFVKKAHTSGSLVDYAKKATQEGVVWLAINSGAAGKQGHGVEANREGVKAFSIDHPVLLDESGSVGRLYGATNTPQMFVIDPKGILVYAGAIDNSPDGEGQSAEGGTLVNYVEQSLRELKDGKPVSKPSTKAYGCSVKYGS